MSSKAKKPLIDHHRSKFSRFGDGLLSEKLRNVDAYLDSINTIPLPDMFGALPRHMYATYNQVLVLRNLIARLKAKYAATDLAELAGMLGTTRTTLESAFRKDRISEPSLLSYYNLRTRIEFAIQEGKWPKEIRASASLVDSVKKLLDSYYRMGFTISSVLAFTNMDEERLRGDISTMSYARVKETQYRLSYGLVMVYAIKKGVLLFDRSTFTYSLNTGKKDRKIAIPSGTRSRLGKAVDEIANSNQGIRSKEDRLANLLSRQWHSAMEDANVIMTRTPMNALIKALMKIKACVIPPRFKDDKSC